VIGVHDGWSSQRLAEAVRQETGGSAIIDLSDVALHLDDGRVLYNGGDLCDFDALIIKKLGRRYAPELLDRLEVLHYLDERGTRVFSRPAALMRLLDRMSCTVMLRLAEIPMPPTVITESVDRAVAAVADFGQAVLKPLYTSKARGMQVVEAGSAARDQIEGFRAAGNRVLYIQQKVALPGYDLGIVFLGGEYLASYRRVAHDTSWHTSTSRGGKYQACDPSNEIIALAQRAQAPFELDFTSVDIVETEDGPLVFEVSAFGGFRGLREANGIDAAEHYVRHVLKRLA
jgi:tetrahydromethanopterin:alpha-L-glutamate ligase